MCCQFRLGGRPAKESARRLSRWEARVSGPPAIGLLTNQGHHEDDIGKDSNGSGDIDGGDDGASRRRGNQKGANRLLVYRSARFLIQGYGIAYMMGGTPPNRRWDVRNGMYYEGSVDERDPQANRIVALAKTRFTTQYGGNTSTMKRVTKTEADVYGKPG
jgi:hypothetical protein